MQDCRTSIIFLSFPFFNLILKLIFDRLEMNTTAWCQQQDYYLASIRA